jgi:hypothetical protein
LALVVFIAASSRAQIPNSALTVAEATKQASQLGSNSVSVHGHFWCGKEGSMIYDSYYKPILLIRYSEIYMQKHTSFRSMCGFDTEHKSNLVTVTGHIETGKDGKLFFLVNEIAFDK